MRKRRIRKQFWFNEEEASLLRKKTFLIGISESSLIRSWIKDMQLKEKPPRELYILINELRRIGTNLNQISHIANINHYIDNNKYDLNISKLKEIIKLIKERYL